MEIGGHRPIQWLHDLIRLAGLESNREDENACRQIGKESVCGGHGGVDG